MVILRKSSRLLGWAVLLAVLAAVLTARFMPPVQATHAHTEGRALAFEPIGLLSASQTLTQTFSSGITVENKPYSIVVHGADQNFVPADLSLQPAEGQKWVLVLAGLNNFQSTPITVTLESLVLVDQAGNRYWPDPPDDQTQPALIGKVVSMNQRALGLVRFQVPAGTVGERVEWCPTAPHVECADPAQSPIPFTPGADGPANEAKEEK